MIVRAAVIVTAAAEAVIVAVCSDNTAIVVTVNVDVLEPAATVTLGGTVAAALSLARLTAKPPVGATLESVTVPVTEVPPFTVDGLRETPERTAVLIARAAVIVTAAAEAVIVAEVTVPTETVVTVNVAVLEPAATVTLGGTVAAALSLARLTA